MKHVAKRTITRTKCPTCGQDVSAEMPEHKRILAALREANGDRMAAANLLRMPRRTFYRRLHKYGIPVREVS